MSIDDLADHEDAASTIDLSGESAALSAEEPTYLVVDAHGDSDVAFDAATDAISSGAVIVLPTDTVYGVGADPFSALAVQRLLDAKRRGRDMPPPVLVAEVEMVGSLADVDDRVRALGTAFWPGALTLVLKASDSLRMDLGDRGATIAVRVPDHEFTRELLRRTGPLAVTSANVSGQEAALTIDEATSQLGNAVSVYLNAGTMSGPVPSTILDLSGESAQLLRAGRLTMAEINEVVPGLLPEVAPDEATVPEPTLQDAAEPEAASSDAADPDPASHAAEPAESSHEAAELDLASHAAEPTEAFHDPAEPAPAPLAAEPAEASAEHLGRVTAGDAEQSANSTDPAES